METRRYASSAKPLSSALVRLRSGFLLGIALVLAAGGASGGASGETLRAAVDRAASLDPLLRTLDARAGEVDANRLAASSAFPAPPSVGASLRRDRPDRDLGRNEVEFEVGLPLWLPGQRALRQRVSGDEGSERTVALVDARLQVAGRVREALWQIAFDRIEEDAARRRLATVERLVEDVGRRVVAGVLARADLLLARAEAAAARGALIEAGARVAQSTQAWRALVGDDALPASWIEAPAQSEESVHPSMAAALGQVDLARSRLKLAVDATRDPPEIGLQHRSDRDVFGADYRNSVRVALRIPLATDARNQPRIAVANTERVRAESAVLQLQRRIDADRARAVAELDAARAQETNASGQLKDAAEHLALVRRAFELGEQSLVAMLRASALADDAQVALERQRTARDRAIARSNQAAGALP